MRILENAYALIIGVDNDQKTDIFLKDAKAFYDVISNESLCGYKKENITLLLDKDATTENIVGALDNYIEKWMKMPLFAFLFRSWRLLRRSLIFIALLSIF